MMIARQGSRWSESRPLSSRVASRSVSGSSMMKIELDQGDRPEGKGSRLGYGGDDHHGDPGQRPHPAVRRRSAIRETCMDRFQQHLRGRLALQDCRDGVARGGEQGDDDAEQLVDGYVDVHLVHAHVEGSYCTLYGRSA